MALAALLINEPAAPEGRPFLCLEGGAMPDDEYADEAAELDQDPIPGLGDLPSEPDDDEEAE